jgi:hypothetical protein
MPGIGLLGCAIIAAYAAEGLEIVACCDVDGATCRDGAGRIGT